MPEKTAVAIIDQLNYLLRNICSQKIFQTFLSELLVFPYNAIRPVLRAFVQFVGYEARFVFEPINHLFRKIKK